MAGFFFFFFNPTLLLPLVSVFSLQLFVCTTGGALALGLKKRGTGDNGR